MPALTTEQSPSLSLTSDDADWLDKPRILSDEEYAAKFPMSYNEKPLSQQLEPIAVVGMGCRLPGDVSSPMQFWDMMLNNQTNRSDKVPVSRFNIDAHLHPNNERPGSFNVPGGHFLNGTLHEFDPTFFNVSPIEAMWMDPQQRKLLEVVYEALESGGVSLSEIEGTRTAVFAASFTSDFQQMSFKEPDFRHSYAATGVDPGILSNRISHVFNLSGPSITVNTACSSSIYAMHNACNALRNGECCAAIVGGTNLILTVDQHMNTAKLGVLSPDSTCHTFDAAANGYGRAEAVGAVYLKRLSDALRDGDPIRGVLRTSAVNSNGKVQGVGITYPNMEGQFHVIRQAYQRGGDLEPRWTGYFECHGTGTPVGDPIEVRAVAQAMGKEGVPRTDDPTTDKLWIGAVKTNIGHSEAASGLSAIIKAVLTVERGVIPPTRGLVNPNPNIDWDLWNVKVPTDRQPFPAHLPVKRVSVNSFGYGGTNGHFVVESVDSLVAGYAHGRVRAKGANRGMFNQKRPHLLMFSAHDKPTLKRNIDAYAQVVGNYNLVDVAYTLAMRRSKLSSRGFVVCSPDSVAQDFADVAGKFVFADKSKPATVGFIFTGQGAQWARMGTELVQYYPSFRHTIQRLDDVLGNLPNGPDWTLLDVLQEGAAESRINEAEFSQPLCTAVQIALVDLLEAWGVAPAVTVGHSSGEMAAGYAAGLLGFDEAIVAAYYRGKAAKSITTDGAMMVVGIGADAVEPYLTKFNRRVVVACYNSPSLVTLSGDVDAIEQLGAEFDGKNIFARIVKTNGKAYHSPHMKPASAVYQGLLDEARNHLATPVRKATKAMMVSSVTNTLLDPAMPLDANYWCANLISPVRFSQAVEIIGSHEAFKDVDLLIEIGPHSALQGPFKQIVRESKLNHLTYLPTLERGKNSVTQLLTLAGQLFLRDVPLHYDRIVAIEQEHEGFPTSAALTPASSKRTPLKRGKLLVELPTYQWNYVKDLWAEPRQSADHRAPHHARHDTLGARLPGGSAISPTWRNRLRMLDLPWLRHHSLGGEAIFPAAGYFSMAIEAVTQMNEVSRNPQTITGYTLRDVSIKGALVIPDTNDGIETLFTMHPSVYKDHSNAVASNSLTWWDFEVTSCSGDGHWNSHMTGTIGINARPRPTAPPRAVPVLPKRTTGKAWNDAFKAVGFDYGPSFQDIQDVRSDGKMYQASCTSTIKVESGTVVGGESRYVLHPATIDANLQLVLISIFAGRIQDMAAGAVPLQVEEASVWLPTPAQLAQPTAAAYAWTDQRGSRFFDCGTQLVGSDGQVVLYMEHLRCVSYEAAVPQNSSCTLRETPFMKLEWNVDIDTLTSASPIQQYTTQDLVALAGFKNPGTKVLCIGADKVDPVALCDTTDLIQLTVAMTPDMDAAEVPTQALARFAHATIVPTIDPATDLDGQEALAAGQFDIVVPDRAFSDATKLHWLLKPGGRVIAAHDQCKSLEGKLFSATGLANGMGIAVAQATDGNCVNGGHANGADARSIAILYRERLTEFSRALFAELESIGRPTFVPVAHAHETAASTLTHVVVTCDLEGPFLRSLGPFELAGLQHVFSQAATVTWISSGGLKEGKSPEQAMATGLARSIRAELATLDFTLVDLNLGNTAADVAVQEVANALDRQVHNAPAKEAEYYVDNGLVHIGRLVPNAPLNEVYGPQSSVAQPVSFRASDALVGLSRPGPLTFTHDDRVDHEAIGDDEVQVRVLLSSLNKEDVLVREGSTDSLTTFSHEIYGEVTRTGANVEHLTLGDKVFGFSSDRMATFQTASAALLEKITTTDKPEEVVTLPLAYATAMHGLTTLANIEEGEVVLVLYGSGNAGAAAVAISKLKKAVPYVAVRSNAEAARVAAAFGLPLEQVIPAFDANVVATLKERTGGRAADIVFSASYVSPTVAHECWRGIAAFGRFVEAGHKDGGSTRSPLDSVPMNRGASYMAFDTLELLAHNPARMAAYLRRTAMLYRQTHIALDSPIALCNVADYDQAVAAFSDDFGLRKTVIAFAKAADDKTIQVLPSRTKLTFRADATYFLVGCLGGLGRSLTAWMAERGAKRFAFMGRSGVNNDETAAFLRKIKSNGATCQIIKGDAAKRADVDAAIASIPAEYPIRGVVHAAMVLRDGMFRTMTHESWTTSILSKVEAGINLHEAMQDQQLDFFVMTSSTSGLLGTPGQSNYAAGNNFLDSLARHRMRVKHQPATSLVLPMVLEVGVVAENPEIEAALKRKGIYGIDEAHLLESFEAAMTSKTKTTLTATTNNADHVIVGMDPSKLAKALASNEVTDSFWTEDPRFRAVRSSIDAASSNASPGKGGAGFTILKAICEAGSPEEARALVAEHFTEKLSRLLLLDRSVFEPDALPITDYGLDSMIGAELRNWIFREYALDIPFQQLNGPDLTIVKFAGLVCAKHGLEL